MDDRYPAELKGFHRRTMIYALVPFVLSMAIGGFGIYRQDVLEADDPLQTVLGCVFGLGVVVFMLTLLYRALIARPTCEGCGVKMKLVEAITIDGTDSSIDGSRWRIIECPQYESVFRIPDVTFMN